MAAAKEQHADRAHAVLSASSAERWLNCTPSARMGENIAAIQSDYADEGTLAHEVSETMIKYLAKIIDRDQMLREMKVHKANKHWYDDMVKDCEPYINLVLDQKKSAEDTILLLEQKLDYSAFVPFGFGTGDAVIISPSEGILYVTDLKFGRGVRVSAVDNSQLKLYGVGALQEHGLCYDIHTVRLTVCQPRINNTSTWDISVDDLLVWAEAEVAPVAQIAFVGAGEPRTGDWCKFCKAKIICPALKGEAIAIAKQDFEEIKAYAEAGDLQMELDESLIGIYHMADRIRSFLDDVEAHLFRKAVGGHKLPGLKLVYGRSKRSISDENGALNLLREAGYEDHQISNVKIKGIKELEKLLGDDFDVLADFVHKPQGKPTLVPETDTRTSVNAADDYED